MPSVVEKVPETSTPAASLSVTVSETALPEMSSSTGAGAAMLRVAVSASAMVTVRAETPAPRVAPVGREAPRSIVKVSASSRLVSSAMTMSTSPSRMLFGMLAARPVRAPTMSSASAVPRVSDSGTERSSPTSFAARTVTVTVSPSFGDNSETLKLSIGSSSCTVRVAAAGVRETSAPRAAGTVVGVAVTLIVRGSSFTAFTIAAGIVKFTGFAVAPSPALKVTVCAAIAPTPLGSDTATVTVTGPPGGRGPVKVTSAVMTASRASRSRSSETAAEEASFRARRAETESSSVIVTVVVPAPDATSALSASPLATAMVRSKVSPPSDTVSSSMLTVTIAVVCPDGTIKVPFVTGT